MQVIRTSFITPNSNPKSQYTHYAIVLNVASISSYHESHITFWNSERAHSADTIVTGKVTGYKPKVKNATEVIMNNGVRHTISESYATFDSKVQRAIEIMR